MAEHSSSPQRIPRRSAKKQSSSPRETQQKKIQRFQRELQDMQSQLLTENNLRRFMKDITILEGFKGMLTKILVYVKKLMDKPAAKKYFVGINTFCTHIDAAITQIDVTLDALDEQQEIFNAQTRTQAYEALKKCRDFIESARQQFKPLPEI